MNELIDELAFQSGITQHRFSDPKHPDLDGFIVSQEKLDKFAEMIIKQCANRATWAQDTGEKDIGGEVLKHFGVMKPYEEMIQWMVDNNSLLKYHEWPAVMAISEIYDVPQQTVFDHMRSERDLREQALKEKRKAEHRARNEQRRLANLATNGAAEE